MRISVPRFGIGLLKCGVLKHRTATPSSSSRLTKISISFDLSIDLQKDCFPENDKLKFVGQSEILRYNFTDACSNT
jgi:hypothetical protein